MSAAEAALPLDPRRVSDVGLGEHRSLAVSPVFVRSIVVTALVAAAADSLTKEMLWVPRAAKDAAFFVLSPVILACVFALIPYAANRMALLSSGSVRRYLLNGYVALSVVLVVAWAVLAYQGLVYGKVNTNVSLFLKDLLLVSGAAVFALLTGRLLRWYTRTRNLVVLLLALLIVGYVLFYVLHLSTDYLARPTPPAVLDAIAASFLLLLWSGYISMLVMHRSYRLDLWFVGLLLVAPVLITGWELILRLQIPVSLVTRSVLNLGLILSPLVYTWGFLRLVPALPNPTAGEYFRSLAYSFGLMAATSCGMGLGLPTTFPLSGYPSLMLVVPTFVLAYAGFASTAAYFSIEADVRKRIQAAASFMASIGEAEAGLSVERQVRGFYDRFAGLARESGAVEASALTEKDIYSYVSALKQMQDTGGAA